MTSLAPVSEQPKSPFDFERFKKRVPTEVVGATSPYADHSRESCVMSSLLFLRRSYEYRHAAATVFRKARALPMGAERNMARVLARGSRDLARTEAWLEGNRCHARRQRPESHDIASFGALFCPTDAAVYVPDTAPARWPQCRIRVTL